MKQKTFFLSVALISTMIYSCKKDKDTDPTAPTTCITYPNFSQLKVGNYWVYEQFDIDAIGNATSKNTFDSCYVEKDTIINSKTYLKMVKPNPYSTNQSDISYQKDSLHYIVNSNGKILFSSQDFSTIFEYRYFLAGPNDTVCQIVKQMADENLTVTTLAGTFTTSNAKETYSMYPNSASVGNPRNKHTRYAENMGIVIETLPFFASSPNYIERRLVRYHFN
jgi:hypothetical protein